MGKHVQSCLGAEKPAGTYRSQLGLSEAGAAQRGLRPAPDVNEPMTRPLSGKSGETVVDVCYCSNFPPNAH